MFATGGCSEGFGNLGPTLTRHAVPARVGQSRWLAFPARETLEAVAAEIRSRPEVTHRADPACARCDDAARGGPVPPGAGADPVP